MKRVLKTILVAVLVTTLALNIVGCKSKTKQYELAIKQYKSQNYAEAIENFTELQDYKESEAYIEICTYELGKQKLESGDYDKAYDILEEISYYKDTKELLANSRFKRAKQYLANDDYDTAIDLVEDIGAYKNYDSYLSEIYYNYGVHLYNSGNYDKATQFFSKSDQTYSTQNKYLAQYFSAVKQANSGNYLGAYKGFQSISGATHDNRVKAANHTTNIRKKLLNFSWHMSYSSDRSITFTFDDNKGYLIIFATEYGDTYPVTSTEFFAVHAYDGIVVMDKAGKTYSLDVTFNSESSIRMQFSDSDLSQANGTYSKMDLDSNESVYYRIGEDSGKLSYCKYSFDFEYNQSMLEPPASTPSDTNTSSKEKNSSASNVDNKDTKYEDNTYENNNYEEDVEEDIDEEDNYEEYVFEDDYEEDVDEEDNYEEDNYVEDDYEENFVFEAE